jgi:hypothetical protein
MSAPPAQVLLQRRNREGVLLRYETDGHQSRKSNAPPALPSDRLRCALLRSEREIRALRIMLNCLGDVLSELALDRFERALATLEKLLGLVRDELDAAGGPPE